ncbi:alpha/beta hydrolase [Oxalobacter formigenes]|uniref:Carboxylesterase Est2 domain protein n=1 Tax=Oxalobacter formigenes OXCC13 TaxID=556269 RepID=C3X9D1_OXAFO|nr:alpha/beta hydrolase [Oxalobacter formigenes]ARQ46068.1 Carboxylesterase NlhH [Oxalobacter formigenes]ARQ78259.1 alpha/beta hydrolase [Oxalobacter formigenes OXCC13]EEO29807.1 carboxylesterase Est2 domain protein [Oxalobacter formigenes OXCC13]MCZ4063697.1 alpha/beta hydrolase [Oxalobacter formigenes]QDX33195.1 alpha/beta hydrolase [Oxalobacter formigenes]
MPDSKAFDTITVSEVTYLEKDGQTARALIYRPKGDGPFPALVCVHGGAWVSGDRFATAGFAELVAEKGIVVMAIDTRLAPACPYPASVADVNYATRWLKYHSGRYKVDPDRVGGLGISSGGQLLLLSAMRYNDPRYMIHELQASGKELDARLAFVITCSGVLDPLARYRMAEESSNMAIVLCHRAYFGDEKTMEESSPLLILKRGEKTALPDALFFQGEADPRLPADTAQNMANAWKSAGGNARAIVYQGAGHSIGSWHKRDFSDMLLRISSLCHSPANKVSSNPVIVHISRKSPTPP